MEAEAAPIDRLWEQSRESMRQRLLRVSDKRWQIVQCAAAAGVSWLIAAELLGHQTPFFAPVAAVVSLGTSYGQRLRRVAEVTAGVALGVLLADLLAILIGSGWWQLMLVVTLAKHDFAEAEAFGHRHRGFSVDQLKRWTKALGEHLLDQLPPEPRSPHFQTVILTARKRS